MRAYEGPDLTSAAIRLDLHQERLSPTVRAFEVLGSDIVVEIRSASGRHIQSPKPARVIALDAMFGLSENSEDNLKLLTAAHARSRNLGRMEVPHLRLKIQILHNVGVRFLPSVAANH